MPEQQLDRLPFLLPDFTRISWVSDRAREVWESRLKRVSQAWQAIEIESVRLGFRNSALIAVPAEELGRSEAKLGRAGLISKVVANTPQRTGYSSSIKVPRPGDAVSLRLAIGCADAVDRLAVAYKQGNVTRIGFELGYPSCCCEFFRRTWIEAKLRDTTWAMGLATTSHNAHNEFSIEFAGPPQANILWRWMGIRSVPHLPCSFDCVPTISFADAMLGVGRGLSFDREMDDLLAVLSWPVEWSALHGIAEIKTPILKVSTRTDATAYKYCVRRTGTSYPVEGATGIGFPYQAPGATQRVSSPQSHGGLVQIVPAGEGKPTPEPSHNGFASWEAMDAAHAPLVRAVGHLLGDFSGNVLDLGCGNGALLQKIEALGLGAVPHGIDRKSSAIEVARREMPQFKSNFYVGDIWGESLVWEKNYCLALLGVRRLDEVECERAQELLARLATCSDRLLIYLYTENSEHIPLVERAARFGLDLLAPASEDARVSWASARL